LVNGKPFAYSNPVDQCFRPIWRIWRAGFFVPFLRRDSKQITFEASDMPLKVVTCFDNSTHCRDWKNLRALHWTIVQNRLAVLNCFTTGSACFLFLAWV
jgi:hypothetical protein